MLNMIKAYNSRVVWLQKDMFRSWEWNLQILLLLWLQTHLQELHLQSDYEITVLTKWKAGAVRLWM